jgi:hypothetical protein
VGTAARIGRVGERRVGRGGRLADDVPERTCEPAPELAHNLIGGIIGKWVSQNSISTLALIAGSKGYAARSLSQQYDSSIGDGARISFAEAILRVSGFDALDLAAKIGALGVIPENAHVMTRHEVAASLATCVRQIPGWTPKINRDRFEEWVNGPFVAPHADLDSYDDVFTESFAFAGGPFTVFPGSSEDACFILRQICLALFSRAGAEIDEGCKNEAYKLITAVVALSHIIASRAGLARGALPIEIGQGLTVPATPIFDRFVHAVSFTEEELRGIFGAAVDSLARLTTEFDRGSPEQLDPENLPVYAKPILKWENRLVVASPGHLLTALRHELICLLIRCGQVERFNLAFRSAVFSGVAQSLQRIGNEPTGEVLPKPVRSPIYDHLFSLDRDKVLHCLLVTDELERFDPNRVFGTWHQPVLSQVIEQRLREIGEFLMRIPKPPNEVVHLVLVQGLGRYHVLGTEDPDDSASFPRVTLSPSGLEMISALEGGNSMLLWQYARAQQALHRRSTVVAIGDLDLFALYRERGNGFYLSDVGVPDHIQVQPGFASKLRREVKGRSDRHMVRSYRRKESAEVVRIDKDVPIYMESSLTAPGAADIALVVEGCAIPIWIVARVEPDSPELSHVRVMLVDMLAYWTWQLTSALADRVATVANQGASVIVVEVCPEPGPEWFEEIEDSRGRDACECEVRGPTDLRITITAPFARRFLSADNAGERDVLRQYVRGIMQLPGVPSSKNDETMIDECLDELAPLGRKKKLLVHNSARNPRLVPTETVSPRYVQPADEQMLLDEIGKHLTCTLKWPVGPVVDADRPRLLNEVVSFLFQRLESLVRQLSPNILLESLVELNEEMVHDDAFARFQLPTRIACYTTVPAMVESFKEGYAKRASASVANRFLIEYVAACPPKGLRPFSMGVYDEMLAIAWLVIKFGSISDAINYKLADRAVTVLPSTRIGIGDSAFEDAHAAFFREFSHELIGRSTDFFGLTWDDSAGKRARSDDAEFRGIVDDATHQEFGTAYSRLVDFLIAVFEFGAENIGDAKTERADLFLAEVGARLGWKAHEVKAAFDFVASHPRNAYLEPPSPYAKYDVFPWRHNRGLSYFRKPLLVRKSSGYDEVVWGNRLLTVAVEKLADLCLGGRLDARTKRMKDVVAKIHKQKGEAFNDRVGDLFDGVPGCIVRRRVKKIGHRRLGRADGGDLGDIDVLVANPARRRILAIETKDLSVALTPFEIRSEIDELFGERTDRPGKLRIHLERVAWLRESLTDVLNWLKLNQSDNWLVEAHLVLDQELMSPYLAEPVCRVWSYRRIKESLGQLL